jgi:hypothetical protein
MCSEREQCLRNCSKLPWLTRAQQRNCLRVKNAFIQGLINNDGLGPCLEIEYFYNLSQPTPSVPSLNFAEDLINETHIILKLAYWSSGDLITYAVSFINGKSTWEEVEVGDSYWLKKWERTPTSLEQIKQKKGERKGNGKRLARAMRSRGHQRVRFRWR